MKVVIFGLGKYYKIHRPYIDAVEITAFLDNDPVKSGEMIDGIKVYLPESISELTYDYVIITSKHYPEMRKQLIELGVDDSKILDADHQGLFSGLTSITRYYIQDNNRRKKIIILSHVLDYSGAPLMMLKVAKALVGFGYDVEVISPHDGVLRFDLLKCGVSVTVSNKHYLSFEAIYELLSQAQIIFVNTLLFYPYIKKLDSMNKPVVWWLHEEDNIYKELEIYNQTILKYNNVNVYGVGSRVLDSWNKHISEMPIKELLYGIEDCRESNSGDGNEIINGRKIVYAFVGTVIFRKGEDTFVEAIKRMNECTDIDAEYWIIGSITDAKKKQYEQLENLKVFGAVNHEEVLKLYRNIDVLVCPSRNDPMPVVITEAMMMKKTCIVSDHTGQAGYITAYEDGIVCESENALDLYEKMKWIYDNRERLKAIGEKAYRIYEKYFTIDKFEGNLMDIVKRVEREYGI